MMGFEAPVAAVALLSGTLSGDLVETAVKTYADVAAIFAETEALPPETPVYEVQSYCPAPEGTEGGLFFGTSRIFPGKVNGEYFMTKGHFHGKRDRAEFYWGVSGQGLLLLMDAKRRCRAVSVVPGGLYYIPGETAHRLVNTGDEPLVVGACWPSDAGHDYDTILEQGFPVRIREIEGKPAIVESEG